MTLQRRNLTDSGLLPILLSVCVFGCAFLVFVLEPIIGKALLPLLGGSPAVWNTCLFYFQFMLLAGYVYAHFVARLSIGRSFFVHLILLTVGLAMLPIPVSDISKTSESVLPQLWLLSWLTANTAVPFLLLSATAPLVQSWFSKTSHPDAGNPYFLYAASNTGSLLALLSYPFFDRAVFALK